MLDAWVVGEARVAISAITLVWFSIGGLKDFFIALRTNRRDYTDDGRVAKQPDAPPFSAARPEVLAEPAEKL